MGNLYEAMVELSKDNNGVALKLRDAQAAGNLKSTELTAIYTELQEIERKNHQYSQAVKMIEDMADR